MSTARTNLGRAIALLGLLTTAPACMQGTPVASMASTVPTWHHQAIAQRRACAGEATGDCYSRFTAPDELEACLATQIGTCEQSGGLAFERFTGLEPPPAVAINHLR